MEPDFNRFKQITLNDGSKAYKPDKKLFKKLSKMFPDIVIFGFGKYYQDFWYILASSSEFPENHPGTMGAIPMTEIMRWKRPALSVVPN